MRNSPPSLHLLTLASVLILFGQIILVGCGSQRSGEVLFTLENVTNRQIDTVTISGLGPPISEPITFGSLGPGDTRVGKQMMGFAITLPKTCQITLHFSDGTTSEVDVPVESNTYSDFTGTLAFTIRAADDVQLLVTSD